MNPSQVTNTQMAERQQNIGIEQQLANMKGSQGIFGDFLGTVGGALMGAGMGGGIPGLGGSQSGTPYGNTTPGYLGNQGDAYYYNVPVTYG
jgi:uncharacterized protein YcfJ